jgi:hypothetical protein
MENAMLKYSIIVVFLVACGGQSKAEDCASVLVPKTIDFKSFSRETLDKLSLFKHLHTDSGSNDSSLSATVPIYGVPVTFGGSKNENWDLLDDTLTYFHDKKDRLESVSSVVSELTPDEIQAWSGCMSQHSDFSVRFNQKTIFPNSASLIVARYKTGDPVPPSTLNMMFKNGTYNGEDIYKGSVKFTGEQLYLIERDPLKKLTVEASMDNSPVQTSIVPEVVPDIPLPEIEIRVSGHLQNAPVSKTYKQFNFQVSAGVPFRVSNTGDVELLIEQMVGGKICRTKTITNQTGGHGDEMDNVPVWQSQEMRAACDPVGTPVATLMNCWVDPVYFTRCQK